VLEVKTERSYREYQAELNLQLEAEQLSSTDAKKKRKTANDARIDSI